MKTSLIFTVVLAALFSVSCRNNRAAFPVLEGDYPALEIPAGKPVIFSPGIFCTGLNERDITLSPDGKEIFYGLSAGKMVTIMYSRFNGKCWEEPVVAPFASDRRFSYFEPCFAPDGNSVWFLTTMPVMDKEPRSGWAYQNIFVSERKSDGTWDSPHDPGGCINEGAFQFYPSVTRSGTVYFSRTDPATGRHWLFRSSFNNGMHTKCEMLPEPVNSDSVMPFNVYVSPDETYMIACISSISVEWNLERSNYFIFSGDGKGGWSGPVPLGPEINIPGSNAMSSSLSPDGRYFFFAAQVTRPASEDKNGPVNLSEIINASSSPQNGNYDIYWVDAGVIRKSAEKAQQNGLRQAVRLP